MEHPTSSLSQFTPLASVQENAVSDTTLTPHKRPPAARPLCEALTRFLISEANDLLDRPSTLNRWPALGVPSASDMDDVEIAEAIARSVDPWSLDIHGAERPQPVSLPVDTLITAMEFGAMVGTDMDARALFKSGRMTVFVVSDPQQRTRVVDSGADLFGSLRRMPFCKDAEPAGISFIASQPTTNRNIGQKPAALRQAFHRDCDKALAAVPFAHDGDLRRIAAHEAGHIVMAAMLDMSLPVKAQISPSGGAVTRVGPRIYTQQSTKNELAYLMGGRAAEKVMLGVVSSGSGASDRSDLDQATDLAISQELQWGLGKSGLIYAPVGRDKRHRLTTLQQHTINERLKSAEVLAVQTLTKNRALLEDVTEALMAERELNGNQIAILLLPKGLRPPPEPQPY